MLRVALRGLAARKRRAVLTAVSVVLGVALVAGTFVFTDTLDRTYGDVFDTVTQGSDVVVRTRQVVTTPDEGGIPAFDDSVLEQVRSVDGVAQAAGAIFSPVAIFDKQGDPVAAGAPMFAGSPLPEPFAIFEAAEGRLPGHAGEVALDASTAERFGFDVGDRITVAGARGARRYEISGLTSFGGVGSSGVSTAVTTLAEAQRLTGREGGLDQVSIAAADGVSAPELRDRIDAVLPDALAVRTAEQDAANQKSEIDDLLGILRTALLVFAGIALFVGAFTIFNTFSITVAQRTREFGLLRALGASRPQVLMTVTLEALAVGLTASVLGLIAGIGLAPALGALLEAFGADLPHSGAVVEARTIVVALVVGATVTLAASLAPALRATRVPPIEALREGVTRVRGGRRRSALPLALASVLGGVALILVGLVGDPGGVGAVLSLLGGGAGLVFLGVALLSPRLVGPLAAVLGRPLERLPGVAGRLARENTVRNPARTAVTAAALMVGLALVTFTAVFAAGVESSAEQAVDERFAGDLVLQNADGITPVPSAAAEAAAGIRGVGAVSELRSSQGRLPGTGEDVRASGVDENFARLMSLEWRDGSEAVLAQLGSDGAALDEEWADEHGIGVGDRFAVVTPTGETAQYVARGTFDNPGLTGDFLVSTPTLAADFGERRDAGVLIALAPGARLETVERRLAAMLEQRFPMAEALDRDGYRDRISQTVNQVLGLIYGLLALAVIVSLLGIVNTLALAVHERTREIGLLRAIGMSARQTRRMVRYEAVITTLIGAVLGGAVGVFFGWLVIQPLGDEGFRFTFPAGTLAATLLVAVLVGVLAAVSPARRAARVKILDALAYE